MTIAWPDKHLLHDSRFWYDIPRERFVANAPACPMCGAALDYDYGYLSCCWCHLEIRIRKKKLDPERETE